MQRPANKKIETAEKASHWLFLLFILIFPLSIRKVLYFVPINGLFNEFTGIYLYLSDLILFLALSLWLISIFYNIFSFLSIYNLRNIPLPTVHMTRQKFFTVIRESSTWNILRTKIKLINIPYLGLPAVFLIYASLSFIWAPDKNLAVFKALKLAEMLLMYYFLIYHSGNDQFRKRIFVIMALSGGIQAFIGISQFIIQHSIGLFWLKESLISTEIPGVAEIDLFGAKILRAYGLLPHPNILGGFLFLAIASVYFLRDVPQLERIDNRPFVPRETFNLNFLNSASKIHVKHALIRFRNKICFIWKTIIESLFSIAKTNRFLAVLILGIFLSFSKSALAALLIYTCLRNAKIRHFGTQMYALIASMFYGKRHILRSWRDPIADTSSTRLFLLVLCIILVITYFASNYAPTVNSTFQGLFLNSLSERRVYYDVSRETLNGHEIVGVGVGNYQFASFMRYNDHLANWQFQPVHNVFLLVLVELGMIGLTIFALFMVFLISQRFLICLTYCHKFICSTWNGTITKQICLPPAGWVNDRLGKQFPLLAKLRNLILGILFIMFFDHYFWDIQQGMIIFWLSAGLLAGEIIRLAKFNTDY